VEAMTTPASLERQHTLATAVGRYDQLRMRDLLAAGAEDLPPDDQPEPGPLSREEALELLALSEVIARKAAYGRQLTVRSARAAGASWTQIGAALGTTKQSAWEAHGQTTRNQPRLQRWAPALPLTGMTERRQVGQDLPPVRHRPWRPPPRQPCGQARAHFIWERSRPTSHSRWAACLSGSCHRVKP
jgi:hypothetical protein